MIKGEHWWREIFSRNDKEIYLQNIPIRKRSSIMSARLGRVRGLSKNADAGEGGLGALDKMLTRLTLGSGGVGKIGLKA